MPMSQLVTLSVFLMGSSFVLLISLVVGTRKTRLDSRLKGLSNEDEGGPAVSEPPTLTKMAQTALPRVGAPFIPSDAEERTKLQTRLIHAGFYSRQAMVVFLGTKVTLMFAPTLLGVIAAMLHLVKMQTGLVVGASAPSRG